jgi:hypothetical protein
VPPWTSIGGLLFLVPLLDRLGVPALLDQHADLADAGFPLHLLFDIAVRLDAQPDDPLLAALGEPPLPLPDIMIALPRAVLDLLGPAGPPPESRAPLALAALRRGVRRACRRVVGIGLRTLVARPARVIASRTHIDLVFDLRRVDLRIRRAGLDLDPGFVPWLGRVLHLHYRRGEEPSPEPHA